MKRALGKIGTALLCATTVLGPTGCGGSWAVKDAAVPSQAGGAPAEAAPLAAAQESVPAQPGQSRAKTEVASDAQGKTRTSELLAYEASVTLGVYQVEQSISAVLSASRELGGQIVVRNDEQVVFRVPRARFEEALASIDKIGDVVHRD